MLLATLASYGVYRTIQQMPVKQVQVAERFQVVASKPVPVGMILTPDMVTTIPWPADHAMPGGFTAPADVVGRGVTAPLIENEPVTESKLAPRGAGGGMVTTIPNGMRAMSVRVNDVSGVAGFAVPGTRVDVVVTVRTDRESLSRTVLSNIQVLTAGTKIDTDRQKDGQFIQTAVVTLLVTPADGERLALATTQGQIVLALRNPLDTVPTDSRGAYMANLVGAPSPTPVATGTGAARRVTQPAPPAPAPLPVMNGIRGTTVTQQIIKSGGGGK
jgi:pilus assembly protein CpaB